MSTETNIILEQLEVGPLENFIYLVGDPDTKEVAVVDPAWDMDLVRQEASQKGYRITKILLTHGHPDHINGIKHLLDTHDIPVYISKYEPDYYTPKCGEIIPVEDKEKIAIGNIEVECIHTPGHTPGSQCFLYEKILITGDTLFINGCGRCDLPGGNPSSMYQTLYETILALPEDTLIYSGHNYGDQPFATLKEQKQTNPYFQSKNLEDFLKTRM